MTNIYKNITESYVPFVMGILNVTPDSFSDGGEYLNKDIAVNHAVKMIEEGADIIDIGGESTRPGSAPVNIDKELERVIPVIEGLSEKYPKICISVDTRKSKVAEEAIKSGASIINDVSAGSYDERIVEVAAKYNSPYVLMHMKGSPENMQLRPHYVDVIAEIYEYFEERIDFAKNYGVEKIIIDPGIGFGKRIEDNYEIISRLEKFTQLNYPILIGVSKKSFLGKSLTLDIDNRENATTIAETIAVEKGAKIIRTHNVKNAVQLKKFMSNLIKSELPSHV